MGSRYLKFAVVAGLTVCLSSPVFAQSDAQKALLEKARTLQSRGRDDIAAQVYRQILMADPNNIEAITGLARYYKLSGKDAEATKYLEQLRLLNPGDPNIARIQALSSTGTRDSRLGEAGRLAQAGKYEEAMAIYRSQYGQNPPDGDMALAYYETEFATKSGKAHALEGLRGLVKHYPNEPQYAIALGRVLTYNGTTRAEGIRILKQYPKDGAAQAALRQALLWDVQNPASFSMIREYLKQHVDEELSAKLRTAEEKSSQQLQSALEISPEEHAAYKSLELSHFSEAQERFQTILQKQPGNPRALAGLGFVSMRQGNFSKAVDSFERAEKNGLRVAEIEKGLAESRFWLLMSEASKAFEQGQLDLTAEKYRAALVLIPENPDALEGLAGALAAGQQYAQAAKIFQECLKVKPKSTLAWRGLFLAQASQGDAAAALSTQEQFPVAAREQLEKDPEYLASLANVYRKLGKEEDATRVLDRALALPFPEGGKGQKPGVQLQYAYILAESKRFDQAIVLYRQVIAEHPDNKIAWRGLIDSLHQFKNDGEAMQTVDLMPTEVREASLADPAFLATLAAIYQKQDRLDVARGFLERAVRIDETKGMTVPIPIQLQLASVELLSGDPEQAYALYHKVISTNAENADAWKGFLSSLHQVKNDQEALLEIDRIPVTLRSRLELDVEYQQTLAAIYAATGHLRAALEAMSLVQAHYAAQHAAPPADVEVQNAWLLYNVGDDRSLYPVLMRLGSRTDLTADQTLQVQKIWGSWSVRRAMQVVDAGDSRRALGILDAAAQALPANSDISKAIAGGYARAGKPAEALRIYRSLDWNKASSADYQGAVGAALAVNDRNQAESWLRLALGQYPRDPQILALAARYEQAIGNQSRAAAYWKASLAAMPKSAAADRLAQEMASSLPGRTQRGLPDPKDLASLLNPESPNTVAARQMPLPTYGSGIVAEASSKSVSVTEASASPTSISQLRDYGVQRASGIDPAKDILQATLAPQVSESYSSSLLSTLPNDSVPAQSVFALAKGSSQSVRSSQSTDLREEAKDQLALIEGSHSGWMGGTGVASHRTGTAGYDQLTSLEGPFEASAPFGTSARLTVVTKPVFLDSGEADGNAILHTTNGNIPQPLGSQSDTDKNPPAQQNASGVGGELQLATTNFDAAAGYTPAGFLISNILGRFRVHPANVPFSFSFARDSVKDTQLSYAGLRDPGSISSTYAGNTWGGVVANSGDVQFARSYSESGFYLGVGGQYLTGKHVLTNHRIHGNAGAYWHLYNLPEYGSLTIGTNFFGMSYSHNLRAMTYGMGGYFSPQAYFLANFPVTWEGHYGRNFTYNIVGSFGMQAFQEDAETLFPLDTSLQKSFSYAALPARTSVGGNYELRIEMARALNEHWFIGGFANLNNSRNYNSQTAGFFVRYLFRPQALVLNGPTGMFPHEGFRPFLVP